MSTITVYSNECLLALATSVDHAIVNDGADIITTVTIGGQQSQVSANVADTKTPRIVLLNENTEGALLAIIEQIEQGAEVHVNGKLLVLASDEEQEAWLEAQHQAVATGEQSL